MSKAKNTPDAPEPEHDELLFLVQPAARISSLTYNRPKRGVVKQRRSGLIQDPQTGEPRLAVVEVDDPGDELESVSLTFLPGVGTIRAHELEKCGGEPALKAMGLRLERPDLISPFYAADLAKKSGSRFALRKWLEIEYRPEIRAAIEERLNARDRRLQHERQAEAAADRARDDADPTPDLSGGFGGESRV